MNVNSIIEVLSSQIRSTHALFLGKPMSTRDSKAEDILSHEGKSLITHAITQLMTMFHIP